jgi:hypothetical protein
MREEAYRAADQVRILKKSWWTVRTHATSPPSLPSLFSLSPPGAAEDLMQTGGCEHRYARTLLYIVGGFRACRGSMLHCKGTIELGERSRFGPNVLFNCKQPAR